MSRQHQHATPIFVDHLGAEGSGQPLTPISFQRDASGDGSHDERWLQELIFRFPQALPIAELDTGLGSLIPVCLELPLPSGFVDNLYVTEHGDLVVAECKLWRNPEARREVVAQIIDYAHSFATLTYETLDGAIRKGLTADGTSVQRSLNDIVAARGDIDESRFVDAVSRNLRLGRLLLLVVGDGIREGAETLGEYLQRHAGFHFTLGLVEMPVFRLPNGGYVVQPRVLLRTTNIDRGIVRIEDGKPVIEPVPVSVASASPRTSLTQDRIVESIAAVSPDFAGLLQQFQAAAEPIGVFLDPASKTLMVRWTGPDETDYTLGGFTLDGRLSTYSVNWQPAARGLIDISQSYLDRLANLVGGVVRKTAQQSQWNIVGKDGKAPMAVDPLRLKDQWIALIVDYTQKLQAALREKGA